MSTSAVTARKSIKLSRETYDDLAKQGTVADSFEDVIKRLLAKNKTQEIAN
jgi:predicted CopG family antitoxin